MKKKLILVNFQKSDTAATTIGWLIAFYRKAGKTVKVLHGEKIYVGAAHSVPSSNKLLMEKKLESLQNISEDILMVINLTPSVEQVADLAEGLPKCNYLSRDFFHVTVFSDLKNVAFLGNVNLKLAGEYANILGEGKSFTLSSCPTPQAGAIEILAAIAKTEHKITVSGKSYSGKGSVVNGLATLLGYGSFSCGNDITRLLAAERGMTIEELVASFGDNIAGRAAYDKMTDDKQEEEMRTNSRRVSEGRLAGFTAEKVDPVRIFRIYMKVSLEQATRRALNVKQGERISSSSHASYEEAKQAIMKRDEKDMKAYLQTYNYDYTNPVNYHLVIVTDILNKPQSVLVALYGYARFLISLS